jgi:hypothetical protein
MAFCCGRERAVLRREGLRMGLHYCKTKRPKPRVRAQSAGERPSPEGCSMRTLRACLRAGNGTFVRLH